MAQPMEMLRAADEEVSSSSTKQRIFLFHQKLLPLVKDSGHLFFFQFFCFDLRTYFMDRPREIVKKFYNLCNSLYMF